MHEMSLVKNVVRKAEAVAREAGSPRVLGVTLRIGPLSGLSGAALREHVTTAARGTMVEGAWVEVLEDEKITAGAQELTLESVEVEE